MKGEIKSPRSWSAYVETFCLLGSQDILKPARSNFVSQNVNEHSEELSFLRLIVLPIFIDIGNSLVSRTRYQCDLKR